MVGSAARIAAFRNRSKHTEADLAQALGITSAAYGQLEDDDKEIESSVSLSQALQLAGLLDTDLLSLLDESDGPPPLPIARVRAGLQAELNISPDIRESLEDEIDWDLGPFLEGLSAWGTVYTIGFIKALSAAMSLDWRAVLGGIQNA